MNKLEQIFKSKEKPQGLSPERQALIKKIADEFVVAREKLYREIGFYEMPLKQRKEAVQKLKHVILAKYVDQWEALK
jgi:hypothetical protein